MATEILAASNLINMGFNSAVTQLSNLSPVKLQLLARYFQLQVSRCNNNLYKIRIPTSIALIGVPSLSAGAMHLNLDKKINDLLMIGSLVCCLAIVIFVALHFVIVSRRNTNLSWYNRCNDFIQLNKNISS